jgi:hypothetical protein
MECSPQSFFRIKHRTSFAFGDRLVSALSVFRRGVNLNGGHQTFARPNASRIKRCRVGAHAGCGAAQESIVVVGYGQAVPRPADERLTEQQAGATAVHDQRLVRGVRHRRASLYCFSGSPASRLSSASSE